MVESDYFPPRVASLVLKEKTKKSGQFERVQEGTKGFQVYTTTRIAAAAAAAAVLKQILLASRFPTSLLPASRDQNDEDDDAYNIGIVEL